MPIQPRINIHKVRLDRDFSIVSNADAQNSKLSFGARGLLTYLLSLPETWEIRCDQLQANGGIGLRALRRLIHELVAAGHLHRFALPGYAPGRFGGSRWQVFASPSDLAAILADENRPGGFAPVGKRADVQKGHIRDKEIEKEDKEEKNPHRAAPVRTHAPFQSASIKPESTKAIPPKSRIPTEHEARAFACQKGGISEAAFVKFWRLNEAQGWRTPDAVGKLRPIRDWRKALLSFSKAHRKLPTNLAYKGNNDIFHAYMKANLTETEREYVGPWIDRTKANGWKIKNKVTGAMEPIHDWHKACAEFCRECESAGINPDTMKGAV